MNPRIRPLGFPVIEVRLRFFETLEAQALQRRVLGVSDAALDLALAVGIAHTARQRDGAIVREQIAIQRIQRGIVDVRLEYAFGEVVEHHGARGSAQAAEG